MGSNSNSNDKLKSSGSTTNTNKNDSPGSTTNKTTENQSTKPTITENKKPSETMPKTSSPNPSEKMNPDGKQMTDGSTEPKAQSENPKGTTQKPDGKSATEGKQIADAPTTPKVEKGKDQANSSADTSKLEISDAEITIYSPAKISKRSDGKYMLHVYTKKANGKYAQVILKAKDGTKITSAIGKISSDFITVYFDNVEDKEYNVDTVKIFEKEDGKNPKAAKLTNNTEKTLITLQKEDKLF